MSEPSLEYTLPGVLHFLQAEWRRFEREKNEWAIEKAELKARVALLEGERRGVESIKLTLMKRVKMLEYALRQERKRHSATITKEEPIDSPNIPSSPKSTSITNNKNNNKQEPISDSRIKDKSRQLLKSCLQEINYLTSFPSKLPLTNALNNTANNNRPSSTRRVPPPPPPPNNNNSPVLSQRSKSLSSSGVKSSPPKDEMEVPANVDEVAMINNIKDNDETTSSSSHDNNDALSMQIQEKFHLSEDKVMKFFKHANKGPNKLQEDRLLAGDFDPNQIGEIDRQQQQQQQLQPKIWKPRVTIKGHLDSVRSVCFHPDEMIAASGSDDGTVKIWNLQRATGKDGNAAKKGALEEADPSITFRGHTNIVTSIAISSAQNRIYSASLDSTIRLWRLPSEERGPFSPVDPSLNIATYVGHTDAIWDFKLSSNTREDTYLLASASADGTVKIWDTQTSGNLLKSSWSFDGLVKEEDRKNRGGSLVAPTSLDFCHHDVSKMVVSFANAKIRLYDVETGQVLLTLNGSDETYDNTVATQINRIVLHPTMPIVVSGHEDRGIKFYDLNTGDCIQTVSGHLDGITSLDINPTGNTLVSGGHDSSIRLWSMSEKSCIQEFSAQQQQLQRLQQQQQSIVLL
ncbi:WD40 repeat-like protein [Backusella circina FSU 941]|nr:WD40 repeat-like protein [Backusella circina FSU 941]